MTASIRPVETYLRRPRVLLLDTCRDAAFIGHALHAAPVALRSANTTTDGARILKRTFITVIICDPEEASALAAAKTRSRSNPAPVFLLTAGQGNTPVPDLAGRAVRSCSTPIDARQIVGDVLALAHGWSAADTTPVDIDAHLSSIRGCGLVFCDGVLLPLLRMERLVFGILSKQPGRCVPWAELAAATGASQKLLYVSADRLRRKIEEFIPGHTYIETQPGRGLALDLHGHLPQ